MAAALSCSTSVFETATRAGFLDLLGSDLVFDNKTKPMAIYYDFVLSAEARKSNAYLTLIELDRDTNVSGVRFALLDQKQFDGFDLLDFDERTLAAFGMFYWKDLLRKRRVLLLVRYWAVDVDDRVLPMHVAKISDQFQVEYHVHLIPAMVKEGTRTSLLNSAMMLRLSTCPNPLHTTKIPSEALKRFNSIISEHKCCC